MLETEKILQAINQQTNTLKKLIDDNNQEIKNLRLEINKINEQHLQTKMEIVLLKKENDMLKKESQDQSDRIQRIERGMRAKNLIFNGIPEDRDEEFLEIAVHKIIVDKLDVDCKREEIESVERLGSTGKFPRSILVRFRSESTRNRVIKNRRQLLKGTEIYVDEDYTYEIRKERKALREILKKEKRTGINGFIKYNKLIIGNETYSVKDINFETMTLKKKKKIMIKLKTLNVLEVKMGKSFTIKWKKIMP